MSEIERTSESVADHVERALRAMRGVAVRARKKDWRERTFHRQGGNCHWCCEPMILGVKPSPHEKSHPRLATVEHLDDRYSDERGKHPGKYRKVLACWQCNNDRNRKRQEELPREVLRARSGAYPLEARMTDEGATK